MTARPDATVKVSSCNRPPSSPGLAKGTGWPMGTTRTGPRSGPVAGGCRPRRNGYPGGKHTFRFFQQVLGWTRPKLRDPAAADRWTWLIITCYAQLRLARDLAADLRPPWQQPCPPGRLTPARVRRGFRNIRQTLPCPASAPKPGKPGPGRPPGSKNRHAATHHDVGKAVKRDEAKKKAAGRKVK
jgi:hypothetical protein